MALDYLGVGEVDVGPYGAVVKRLQRPHVIAEGTFGHVVIALDQPPEGVQLLSPPRSSTNHNCNG